MIIRQVGYLIFCCLPVLLIAGYLAVQIFFFMVETSETIYYVAKDTQAAKGRKLEKWRRQ